MELRIEAYKAPEQIIFNYEELKEALLQKCAVYEKAVYTDEEISLAKTDRANLNKLKKALNDERLKREREYMAEFNVFKGQVNEIISIIDKPVSAIDKQVKAFEERQKAEKYDQIKEYWNNFEENGYIPDGITLDKIFDEKWLNASVKMPAVKKAITERLARIFKDLDVIEKLPLYSYEAKEVYIASLDLGKAISEAQKLQQQAEKKKAWEEEQAKRKAEAEREKQTEKNAVNTAPEEQPAKQWIAFRCLLSSDDAKALRNFFLERGIEYKKI